MICLKGRDSQIPNFPKGVEIYLANFAKNGIVVFVVSHIQRIG